jgi:hypothetical protein
MYLFEVADADLRVLGRHHLAGYGKAFLGRYLFCVHARRGLL